MAEIAELQRLMDIMWTMIAAFLVFFMQAGFAFCQCKKDKIIENILQITFDCYTIKYRRWRL